MVKKTGKYPANARVDVDYSKGKPKIKFDYPRKNVKKAASKQGINGLVFLLLWLVIATPGMIIYISHWMEDSNLPKECGNLSFKELNNTYNTEKAIIGFNITCDNEIREFTIYYGEERFSEKREWYGLGWGSLGLFWVYLSIFFAMGIYRYILNPILIRTKWYREWLPKANAEGTIFKRKKGLYKKYKPKDVIEKTIVLPHFKNVILDYKTKGDFSKYLKRIRIREYRTRKINLRKKKLGKEKIKDFDWYAVFYFKQKPKNGYLEVIYK